MASSQRNDLGTPFQDLTKIGNSGQRADPKELKRQRERERYALNRNEILKRRREARDHKKATSAILNEKHSPSKTPMSRSLEKPTTQSQVTQLGYRPGAEGIPADVMTSNHTPFHGPNELKSNRSAFSNKENVTNGGSSVESSQRFGSRSPLQASLSCSLEEKQALKRERENARYERNKDVILQSLREKRRRGKSTSALTTGEQTQSEIPVSNILNTGLHTGVMATGESAVTQLHHTSNVEADEDCDWLHKNDTYQMQEIRGRRDQST